MWIRLWNDGGLHIPRMVSKTIGILEGIWWWLWPMMPYSPRTLLSGSGHQDHWLESYFAAIPTEGKGEFFRVLVVVFIVTMLSIDQTRPFLRKDLVMHHTVSALIEPLESI